MLDKKIIVERYPFLGNELQDEIAEFATFVEVPAHTELVREGQYIKSVPLVMSGLVKVYTQIQDKELLLYYIQANQSCIMSFSAGINNQVSKIFALTEEDTTVLLLPAEKVSKWILKYPNFNKLFYAQYDLRYMEMIDSIHQLMHQKLDQRIHEYLLEKKHVTGKNPLKITHKEIANDLGTAREVVSRILKKLEGEKKIAQLHDSIEVF
jgi:CRP/FNR family transcriptional regulator